MSIFDFLNGDPNPLAQPVAGAPAGPRGVTAQIPGLAIQGRPGFGLFGTGPVSGSQKAALAMAGLRDALASVQGRPSDNFAQAREQVMQSGYAQNQAQGRAALAAAMQSGDPGAIRAARAQALRAGLDPSLYQPRLIDAGNGNVVAVDPVTQTPTLVFQGQRLAPNGFQYNPGNKTMSVVPGGPRDPAVMRAQALAKHGKVVAPSVAPQQPAAPGTYNYDAQGNLVQ